MIRRWIQHNGVQVVRGEGAPPTDGNVYFVGESEDESASIVDGVLTIQGQRACLGTYTFTMQSGVTITLEVDNAGVVIASGNGS